MKDLMRKHGKSRPPFGVSNFDFVWISANLRNGKGAENVEETELSQRTI